MRLLLATAKRVERFFRRQAKSDAFSFSDAPDPRQIAKVKHPMPSVLNALLGGLLRNDSTLRKVEGVGGSDAPFSAPARISDTQLHDLLPRIDQAYLSGK